MRWRNRQCGRRGTTLVYFAMISFALLGLAGLVLDTGFALVTRQQLQTAADTAALEGLRGRDDPAQAMPDTQRRQNASDLVAALFDDNLNPNDADSDPRAYSAGPVVDFSGGLQFGAAQTSIVGTPYRPALQPNDQANDQTGDMVAGTFTGGPPTEDSQYNRGDFTPSSPTSAATASSFLVRLRRTGEAIDPPVGLPGPPLPYLFARGSLMSPTLKTTGIRVRATAIADAQPALTAGIPLPSTSLPTSGVTPFAINSDAWPTLTQGVGLAIDVDAAGNLLKSDMTKVGFATAGPSPMPALKALQIGQAVSQAPIGDAAGYVKFILQQFPQQFNSPAGVFGYGFVPVVGNGSGVYPALVSRVIGFGFVELRPDSSPTRFQLTIRVRAVIAPANASAVPLQIPNAGVTGDVLTKALAANQTFARRTPDGTYPAGVLLTPALVR